MFVVDMDICNIIILDGFYTHYVSEQSLSLSLSLYYSILCLIWLAFFTETKTYFLINN